MRLLYQLGIEIYWILIRIFTLFKPKAKLFIQGRKHWRSTLEEQRNPRDTYVWIHCASLGEFEQGRPFIEDFKKQYPDIKICLSFFSPSGYEIRKNYSFADMVVYLPKDSKRNAKDFIDILKPEMSFFVKYEFWYHYISQLKQKSIPVYLISGIFRDKQVFFKPWGGFFRKILFAFEHIFVQDVDSLNRLTRIGFDKASLSGDTRFDRVWQLTNENYENAILSKFSKEKLCMVAGSTWPQDEAYIHEMLLQNSEMHVVLAPHEIDSQHITNLTQRFSDIPFCLFSEVTMEKVSNCRLIIIDSIGLLSKIYRFGQFAYIGGGFGKGIHNTLEAACYAMPVIFGPNHTKFKEAIDLIQLHAAFTFNDAAELQDIVGKLSEKSKRDVAGKAALNYVNEKRGATQKILEHIQKSDVFQSN